MKLESKDLEYWKNNAEEDYLHTPISVLKYITELERCSAPELLEALQSLMKQYKSIADSGDCGFWKAEEQDVYISAQKAIEKALK